MPATACWPAAPVYDVTRTSTDIPAMALVVPIPDTRGKR
jgi:hypothetical protein